MTESDWLSSSATPFRMLNHLGPRADGRRLRLFAIACAREQFSLAEDNPTTRQLLEMAIVPAERYADGLASADELTVVRSLVATRRHALGAIHHDAFVASCAVVAASERDAAMQVATPVIVSRKVEGNMGDPVEFLRFATPNESLNRLLGSAWLQQVHFLRDIFGNPFQNAPEVDPLWMLANDEAATTLARLAYDQRDVSILPILADALEEAGCSSPELLEHLRDPGRHVRGCRVLDLLRQAHANAGAVSRA